MRGQDRLLVFGDEPLRRIVAPGRRAVFAEQEVLQARVPGARAKVGGIDTGGDQRGDRLFAAEAFDRAGCGALLGAGVASPKPNRGFDFSRRRCRRSGGRQGG